MSVISNSINFSHVGNMISDSLQNHIEHTVPNSIKNIARSNSTQSTSNYKNINNLQSLVNISTNSKYTNCVSKLNLSSCHLDKLNIQYSTLNKTRRSNVNIKSKLKKDNDREIKESVEENNSDTSIDNLYDYQVNIITNIHKYMQSNEYCSSYIIILFFEYIYGTDLICKQCLTVIPFYNDKPIRSISDISIVSKKGNLEKYNNPTFLHIGGYKYTLDWLNISYVMTLSNKIPLRKISIDYGDTVLYGLCLDWNLDNDNLITNNTNIKLHIPGLSKIWK